MYCKQIINSRLAHSVYPLVDAPEINYYNPEQNCLAACGGKNLCGICGEKHKWKKGNSLKTHSTKCCPYKYHSGIATRKDFVDAMAELIKWTADDVEKDEETHLNHIDEQNKEIDSLQTEVAELKEETVSTKSNLEFMKELFSPTQIKERADEVASINQDLEYQAFKMAERVEKADAKDVELNKKLLLIQIIDRGKSENKKIIKDLGILNLKLTNEKKSLHNTIAVLIKENDAEDIEKSNLFKEKIQLGQDNLELLKIIQNDGKQVQSHYKQFCIFCQDCIDEKGLTTECGHHFHLGCYNSYIKHKCNSLEYGSVNCPLCNFKFFDM